MRRAVVVAADRAGLVAAADKLKAGGNVAFPTETVYGLGGNALDETAVQEIFVKKGRPLTDPLIVHVLDPASALELVNAKGETKKLFEVLAEKFWPGPLTMVLEANEKIPPMVCANTGFVGVRCPAHPIARDLLEASGLPVAAPSANRFGHVSPTSAQHVVDDLGDHDIIVIDGGNLEKGACQIGIESTVLKVVDSSVDCEDSACDRSLILYRKGGVSETAIRAALDQAGFANVKIVPPTAAKVRTQQDDPAAAFPVSNKDYSAPDDEAQCAPGQLITHYAPDADTWLLRTAEGNLNLPENFSQVQVNDSLTLPLDECAVVDFNGTLGLLKSKAKAYRDVSSDGKLLTAAQNLFDCLRWTETTDAKHVLIKDVSDVADELAPSVADRMFRAASGKVADGFKLV